MQQPENSRSLAGFGAKSARMPIVTDRISPFASGSPEDEIDSAMIEELLALPEPRTPPRRFAVGPFGGLVEVDDEQFRIPARRGGPGSTGCAVRFMLGWLTITLVIGLLGAGALCASRWSEYRQYLAAEARI